jgi:hypothetical protein
MGAKGIRKEEKMKPSSSPPLAVENVLDFSCLVTFFVSADIGVRNDQEKMKLRKIGKRAINEGLLINERGEGRIWRGWAVLSVEKCGAMLISG